MTSSASASPGAGPSPRVGGLPPARRRELRRAVLAWFEQSGRDLAFRSVDHPDPWGVLVSEVMAQQTQVARVDERWPVFMAAFPTPAALAAASPADAIRAWRGLGYNRRALGLHRAAVEIAARGGALPADVEGLEALPGVGPYTARAVAAIAFGRPVGAVDVNVRRVVGRIVAGDPSALSRSELQAAADALVDPRRPGAWTHALMDLGATVCRPARPACGSCPARRWCVGRAATTHAAGRGGGVRGAARPGATTRGVARPASTPAMRFELTSRWLRGRIVDRLRDLPDGEAVRLDAPVGEHSGDAVVAAVRALVREGVVEVDAAGRARLAGSVAGR